MTISSNTGIYSCIDFGEYRRMLEISLNKASGNEIWVSRDGYSKDGPCSLGILVKDGQAVVNYFSEGNQEIYVSIGDLSKEGTVEFEGGKYSVAAYQVIPVKDVLEVALQFWDSQGKPETIQWEEL